MAKAARASAFKTITVGIASDAIEKISKVSPDSAIEELIWNAIDAEASRIEVIFYENTLKGIDRIVVADNGHGISEKDAENIFGNIGGSPKRLRRRSPNLDRPYHGKEGQGRYKAFSLGRKVAWHSRSLTNGNVQTFFGQVAQVSDDQGNSKLGTGVVVEAVLRGVLLAYDTQKRLQKEGLARTFTLDQWNVEAGAAFFDDTVAGVQKGIATAKTAAAKRSSGPYATGAK